MRSSTLVLDDSGSDDPPHILAHLHEVFGVAPEAGIKVGRPATRSPRRSARAQRATNRLECAAHPDSRAGRDAVASGRDCACLGVLGDHLRGDGIPDIHQTEDLGGIVQGLQGVCVISHVPEATPVWSHATGARANGTFLARFAEPHVKGPPTGACWRETVFGGAHDPHA